MPTSVSPPVWIASIVLSVLCLSTAKDVKLCGNDSVVELTAGQTTSVFCKSEGVIQWRLHVVYNGSNESHHLTYCTEEGCTPLKLLKETFSANITDAHTKTLTINSEKNTKIHENVLVVSSALECVYENYTHSKQVARCGLNYVYPSENVSCEGVATSGTAHVSCVIGSVYSSRGIYRCQLFTRKHSNKSLETVDMVTSPTSERITRREVKVSGSCQFNTTLLPEEECYDIFVSVSPGGRNYYVNLNAHVTQDQEWISADITGGVIAAVVVVILAVVYIVVSRQKRYTKVPLNANGLGVDDGSHPLPLRLLVG